MTVKPSSYFTQSKTIATVGQEQFVHIGGNPIGIAISANGLIVAGIGGVRTDSGEAYPTRNIIVVGDVIKEVNGESVNSIYKLKKILNETEGDVTLTIERHDKLLQIVVTPAVERATEQRKLGLALKEDVGGIGTMTFVTKGGGFAALGHYITDGETGLSTELDSGNIYNTSIEAVEKGEIGKAGGLIASVNRLSTPVGRIKDNSIIGLYGEYIGKTGGSLVRVALKGEAKPGHAQVLTTIEGDEPKFYDIEIVKVISQTEPADKGMVIMVSDKELLKKTGGIVQGMSGSPIVQDGVLIGAVTHVFVQDPTRGYAVHARFMYDEAKKYETEKQQENDILSVPNIDDIDIAA
ncbi:MAG: SpoIVB peptidase [Clostridia bacterium]|nr:SpoIVB peptidase [Clostridia bacterium]